MPHQGTDTGTNRRQAINVTSWRIFHCSALVGMSAATLYITILRISANAYRIIPHAPITLQGRHEPGRLYRRTEGRVRLDRPRSGARLRRAISPVRHAPDGPSDLRSRAVPRPSLIRQMTRLSVSRG